MYIIICTVWRGERVRKLIDWLTDCFMGHKHKKAICAKNIGRQDIINVCE